MASNSTSPDPSSSESFQYDVYASYRGKDVRKRIVDVLYWAFEGTGVNYFSEYEEVETQGKMPTLDRIKVVLKQSRSAIVIFSKNYASLPWCLNELVEIMARQLPVYVVFYDVSPTDVGEQQGDFGKEFNSVAAMKEFEDKKAGWKNALKDAANLPDKYDLTDTDGFESSCITEIVQWCLSHSQNKFNKFMIDCAAKVGGKLAVWREKIIGTGSDGTFVCEGSYIDRPVAVKCLKAKDSNSLAFNEFEILRACDHPNIVGLHGIEKDKDYVYLSLEKCDGNLKDLIEKNCTGQLLERVNDIVKDPAVLWRENGYPSPLLLKLMRDVVKGLVYLHNSAIVHGDLKPENVLFKPKQKSLCAKICDMGTSKRLNENESEEGTDQIATGRADDVFRLGRVLFYCITRGKGKCPFDDIDLSLVQLSSVESIPEATDLFSRFLDSDAKKWPTASEVLQHPLLWKTKKRLSFLRKTSDMLNNKKTTTDKVRLEVYQTRSAVFGDDKEWTSNMDDKLIENLKKSPGSKYNYESVVHLLRAIRNKYHHYEELSDELKDLVGTLPEGFDEYFATLFPKLLMEVYKVMDKHCRGKHWFQKYIISNDDE